MLLTFILPISSVMAQSDTTGSFRAACDLLGAADISEAMGLELSSTSMGAQACIWGSDGPTLILTLDENGSLDMEEGLFPGADAVTVAGHAGISMTLEGQEFTTVIVGLDDGGVVQIQVVANAGVPDDPAGAALAAAEAIFSNGPVLARPSTAPSGPALGYDGDICELATLAEVKQATGKKKFVTATADTPDTCTYASSDFTLLVSLGFIDGELYQFAGGDAEDLEVDGRAAVWSTQFFDTLVVDVGGGRLLQIGLLAYDAKPAQKRDAAAATAEIAVGRLVPIAAPGSEAPVATSPSTATAAAGPGCDLVPVEQVASITGLPFTTSSDEGVEGFGCSYTAADTAAQPSFVVISLLDFNDMAAAMTAMTQGMPGFAAAVDVDIAGHPGLISPGEVAALAMIDLDAVDGHENEVLAVVWLAPPPAVDAAGIVTSLAEVAIGNL